MIALRRILAVCRYELERSLTPQRIMLAAVLALFPPVMLGLVTYYSELAREGQIGAFFEFVLIFLVGIVCLLALLLWASTNVYSELEEKTWIYVACRPYGRVAMIGGKCLAAALSAFAVCFTAITLSVAIGARMNVFEDAIRSWLTLLAIFGLASLTYAAVFSMIGALFYRRAMVFSAGYVVLFELVFPNLPALISKFTVRYHLQELGLRWLGWFLPQGEQAYRDVYPAISTWIHWVALTLIIGLCLTIACVTVVYRQFLTADET